MSRHTIGPVSIALFALAIAAPAFAGGPLEAPDGTGPSGLDFTGWTPVAFVFGGNSSGGTNVEIACMNLGSVETNIAVQWYDSGDDPTRQPVEEDTTGNTPPSDIDLETIAATPGNVTARILVEQKKAAKAVQCSGMQVSGADPVAQLEVVYIKKAPKIKISK